MTDQQAPHHPIGSVADEAARLVDALGEWARTREEPVAGTDDHPAGGYADGAGPTSSGAGGQGAGDHSGDRGADGHCPTCGAATGVGRAESCRVCPVCQGIAVLRSVRPETVDRLADLAGALAAGLRDLAASVREQPGPARAPADASPGGWHNGGGRPPGPPKPPVAQDIPVTDEQESRS